MHIHCRRHIMYAIIKESMHVFHELGKLIKTLDIYIYIRLYGTPESQMHNEKQIIKKISKA